MAGNRTGGLKAAETNKKKYGDQFYKTIGAAGGTKSRGGGFAAMRKDRLKRVSSRGGSKSRRYHD